MVADSKARVILHVQETVVGVDMCEIGSAALSREVEWPEDGQPTYAGSEQAGSTQGCG